MSRLVWLYPAAWRTRYEAEFVALLEDRPPSLLARVDIVRSALDAHLHPQVLEPRAAEPVPPLPEGDIRLSRRLGLGAFAGTVLWMTAWALYAAAPVVYDGYGPYRDGAAAGPLLFGAVALLAGGLIGQLVRLPRSARLARIGAVVAVPFTLLWGLAPWLLWAAVPMIGGLVALAVGARMSRAWSNWPAGSVAVACVVVVGLVTYGMTAEVDRMAGGVLLMVAAVAFTPAWLGVAGTLVAARGT
jgi:hypothetical protein